jgi:tetratricopeptide (TPR) repeat protein
LEEAINALKEAVVSEPNNAQLWAELARIQTYSYTQKITREDQTKRLQEALDSINQAVKLDPESSTVHAIRAFVLDWNAILAGDKATDMLVEAEQEAIRALQLDPTNTLALAFYAEILTDEQKLVQAEQYIQQAVQRDPSLMDVHRINAYVMESNADYKGASEEYKKAITIAPNLTFLYIRLGNVYYLTLKDYPNALDVFAKAANINQQLGVQDPIPYISIAKTYVQEGEFFIAARNIIKALTYEPTNPNVYGETGIILYKGKNYEGSLIALKCATLGCSAQESCDVRECDDPNTPSIVLTGLPLDDSTVVYYYTYGSALAGLHRKSNNYCAQAVKILAMVRDKYQAQSDIMSIIDPSVQICASYGFNLP